jgi:glucose-6-phosphate isomerase
MADPVTLPVWAKLEAKARELRGRHLRELFAADPRRAEDFAFEACGLFADLSRHRVDRETLDLLLELARAQDVEGWRARMFAGEPINTSEQRAVLHVALRDPDGPPLIVEGADVRPFIRRELERMRAFCDGVHAGTIRGATGERFRHVLHIGIGGSELGPRAVCEALRPEADRGMEVRFVANVDPQDLALALAGLDPARTLIIVASKTFSTQETMLNARAARAWLTAALGETAVGQHMVAVSSRLDRVAAFGIPEERCFGFGDWVGGRFSLWSPVGLPIALFAGFERFRALLAGARAMDQHFLEAPAAQNVPLLLGLLDVWYADFLGAESRAVVPYDESLRLLPLHLQQLEMESNGKSTRRDGGAVRYPTGLILWGSTGSNGQHAYFQLLHQGTRLVPLDILVAAQSRVPESDERHLALVAHALAQSRALAFGRTAAEARHELAAEGLFGDALEALLPHRLFAGNRPSTVILARRFDASTLGALLALFEHRVFVQGAIWDINSFDQWGVELGKQMADGLLPALRDGQERPGLDPATLGLLAKVRAWRQGA